MSEAHVSTQQPSARQAPRVPAPDVHPGRSGHYQGPARQGPLAAVGLIWRIQRRSDFDRFRREGQRIRLGPLWVSVITDAAAAPAHVAFAVGRSVGPAVVRNTLRRRLRALMAELIQQGLPPGWYLVGATPPAAACSFGELRAHLAPLLPRLTGARPS